MKSISLPAWLRVSRQKTGLIAVAAALACLWGRTDLCRAGPPESPEAAPKTKVDLSGFEAAELIRGAIARLDGESANIQIQGRALTPEERRRVAAIRAARPHLDKALQVLKEERAERKRAIPESVSAEELIRQAIGQLRGEYGRIMVVGRALTPAEKARMEALQAAMEQLNKALKALQQKAEAEVPPLVPPRGQRSPSDLIHKAMKALAHEAARIQVQGRALTPDEVRRLEAIKEATAHLQKAVDILGGGDDESPPDRSRR